MEKFPFSPDGLTDLLNGLFALPDPELQLKAAQIGNHFRTFIAEHFQLSTHQLLFLANMDENFIQDASSSSKSFVERRLMIGLIKANPPDRKNPGDDDDKDRGKLVDLDKKETSSFSREQGYQHIESLTFIISYQSQN